jgi:2-hydroxychromene-2-carboxylate isomerase
MKKVFFYYGMPTFEVEGAIFWGNDRLVLLQDHLAKAAEGSL